MRACNCRQTLFDIIKQEKVSHKLNNTSIYFALCYVLDRFVTMLPCSDILNSDNAISSMYNQAQECHNQCYYTLPSSGKYKNYNQYYLVNSCDVCRPLVHLVHCCICENSLSKWCSGSCLVYKIRVRKQDR